MGRREEYQRYIQSEAWKAKRREAFAHYGRECQWCGETRRLQVHHLHYLTLYRERVEDLEILCPACHEDADIRRAREGERRAAEALYQARLDGWATAKYGENWGDDGNDMIEEEFSEWLEAVEERGTGE